MCLMHAFDDKKTLHTLQSIFHLKKILINEYELNQSAFARRIRQTIRKVLKSQFDVKIYVVDVEMCV